MLSVLKKVGLVVLVLIVALLAYAATRPNQFTVTRSTSIAAPADRIYSLIADFHQWSAWSPWEKLDPNLERTFEGPQSGPGAIYSWKGNKDVGAGRMEIKSATPPESLAIALDFIEPFESKNKIDFTINALGGSTDVTWTMTGENNFVGKLMSVFVDFDKMVGKDFETGLANLKAEAEK